MDDPRHIYIVVRNPGYLDSDMDVFTDRRAAERWHARLGGDESGDSALREEPILDWEFASDALTPGEFD